MLTVADVVKELGGNKAVAERFGVTPPAVSNWKAWNKFPPKLHLTILRECQARGIDYDPAPDKKVA